MEDVTGNDVEIKLENISSIAVREERSRLDPRVGEEAKNAAGQILIYIVFWVVIFAIAL